jgi:hypothetical protein
MEKDDMIAIMTSILLANRNLTEVGQAAPLEYAIGVAARIYEATHRHREAFAPEPR